MAHAYDNPDLSDVEFLLAVMRDQTVPRISAHEGCASSHIRSMNSSLCKKSCIRWIQHPRSKAMPDDPYHRSIGRGQMERTGNDS